MLIDNIRKIAFKHIKENAEEKDIFLDTIGGYREHAHCIVSLGSEQTISKVVQLIKGESSFGINKAYSPESKFTWQNGYWAASISENHLESVRKYIQNQENHHREISFVSEIEEFENFSNFRNFN